MLDRPSGHVLDPSGCNPVGPAPSSGVYESRGSLSLSRGQNYAPSTGESAPFVALQVYLRRLNPLGVKYRLEARPRAALLRSLPLRTLAIFVSGCEGRFAVCRLVVRSAVDAGYDLALRTS